MRLFTPKTTITFGLVSIMVSTMISVLFIGIAPNAKEAEMRGRARLCESIAIDTSIHFSRNDHTRIRSLLEAIVERNPDIISAGVRRLNGQLSIKTENHAGLWNSATVTSTETHVQVPLREAGKEWGAVEILFQPLEQPGFTGWIAKPWVRYIAICAAIAFIVFSFYFSFVLRQLDPSEAVPKRVRTALDSLAEGLLVTDERGRVILANQAFAAWAGRSAERLVGHSATRFPWTADNPEQKLELPWVLAIERQDAVAGHIIRLVDHQDQALTLVANSSPVLGSDGQYRGVLTSFENITELEEKKRELVNAKLAADEANRSKSEFLAHMSHEIRTPMNAILGYTEVLRSGIHDPEPVRRKHLGTIQASGQHLLSLINDILDLSKIESGRLELEVKRCPLKEIFSQVLSVMKIKSDEKQILLGFEAEGDMPETILTDEVRLRQTLINLVGNAIKFTDKGGVGVLTRMINQEGRAMLQVDVADTGIGMSPEAMEKIFNPFSQADNSITRRFGGTGLGLAISRQLVEKLGGEINVSSQPGKGSKFSITIDPGDLTNARFGPVNLEKDSEQEQEPEEAEINYLFDDQRILVVDDSETNRELISLFLRRSNAIVEMAENGQVALDKSANQSFDAILMDMQMPVMDGFTATGELRRRGFENPIIALTANVMKDDEQKCRDAGCCEFLPKPVSKGRLLNLLARLLPHTIAESTESESLPSIENNCKGDTPEFPNLQVDPNEDLDQIYEGIQELSIGCSEPESDSNPAIDSAKSHECLESELPMDDADFRLIVEMFVDRLRTQMPTFREALIAESYVELADLAHWLKGSGGTAGFECFTEPSRCLQEAAEQQQRDECDALIATLEALTSRVFVPALAD